MTLDHPNRHLIGAPDARQRLATPALLVDLRRMEQNLDMASALVRPRGKALRPHFKAHKSLEIARRQLDRGAVGISVATVSEAEAVGMLGAEILLTSVISTSAQHARIAKLAAARPALMIVVDNEGVLASLNHELKKRNATLGVLIDIDMGRGRSGCRTIQKAQGLAEAVNRSSQLQLKGMQCYAGQLSHMAPLHKRRTAYDETTDLVETFRAGLADYLPGDPIVSGGSTGSMSLDLDGPLTELQCGSYVFMDGEYLSLASGWDKWPFKATLFVQSSILSANWPDHVVTDGGDKWFQSKYQTEPIVFAESMRGMRFEPMSDEHGFLHTNGESSPAVGDLIECVPPHCDPTINLYSAYHVFEETLLVEIWPIKARGC